MAGEDPPPRLRKVRVDPFGTSDLAREHKLTAHEAWLWHVLALQSEYRSGEWSGTLTDMADPKLFSTGDVGPGQVKTFKAPGKAGSYPYFCTIHQYMTGTLVVR